MRQFWALFFLAGATAWPAPPLVSLATMSASNQALVAAVTEHCTLQRVYAPRRFGGRAEQFAFLLDHMDACSVLAEQAGFIDYRARLLPDGRLYAENTEQAAGFLALVDCRENYRAYYVEGTQRGVFTAKGRGVVVVRFAEVEPGVVEYTGQLFVHIDNGVAAALAKAFFLFLKHALDHNFDHVMRQAIDVARLGYQSPEAIAAVIRQLPAEDYALVAGWPTPPR